ncbi:MAG: hypothetical protein J5851_08180 [Oscillospiraceae bacterium]|nr:hypothetical protein [Oscillospiraceae bacterium]
MANEMHEKAHVRAFLMALVLLNLLGVLIMPSVGGWALLPALIWFLTAPILLANQQTGFGKCAFRLYGKFLLWGIASLLLFMIGGGMLAIGLEYLDAFLNRGP